MRCRRQPQTTTNTLGLEADHLSEGGTKRSLVSLCLRIVRWRRRPRGTPPPCPACGRRTQGESGPICPQTTSPPSRRPKSRNEARTEEGHSEMKYTAAGVIVSGPVFGGPTLVLVLAWAKRQKTGHNVLGITRGQAARGCADWMEYANFHESLGWDRVRRNLTTCLIFSFGLALERDFIFPMFYMRVLRFDFNLPPGKGTPSGRHACQRRRCRGYRRSSCAPEGGRGRSTPVRGGGGARRKMAHAEESAETRDQTKRGGAGPECQRIGEATENSGNRINIRNAGSQTPKQFAEKKHDNRRYTRIEVALFETNSAAAAPPPCTKGGKMRPELTPQRAYQAHICLPRHFDNAPTQETRSAHLELSEERCAELSQPRVRKLVQDAQRRALDRPLRRSSRHHL